MRFYRDVLGLRLVKKTCNQENPTSGWHFFFGDRLHIAKLVMTDGDHVTMLQRMLLDQLAIDVSAIGAAQILKERVIEDVNNE